MSVVVSLTTIPPRFAYLSRTVGSLQNQRRKPDRIIIHVPERYGRFSSFGFFGNDRLRELERAVGSGVEIHPMKQDFGPATKLIGLTFMSDVADDDLILCVDDDREYDSDLVLRHAEFNSLSPSSVKTEAGWEIEQLSSFSYRKKLLPRGKEYAAWGYVDCLGGCCGFSLRNRNLDANLRNVPDESFFVDDIFFSAYFARKGIPIEVLAGGKDQRRTPADRVSPLVGPNTGDRRLKQNEQAVQFFRENWNIWVD